MGEGSSACRTASNGEGSPACGTAPINSFMPQKHMVTLLTTQCRLNPESSPNYRLESNPQHNSTKSGVPGILSGQKDFSSLSKGLHSGPASFTLHFVSATGVDSAHPYEARRQHL